MTIGSGLLEQRDCWGDLTIIHSSRSQGAKAEPSAILTCKLTLQLACSEVEALEAVCNVTDTSIHLAKLITQLREVKQI